MKKITKTLIAVCLGAFALTSCQQKPDKPEFDSIVRAETYRTDDKSFELDYRFEYLSWYKDQNVAAKIRTSMTADFFGAEYAAADPMESSEKFDLAASEMYDQAISGDYKWNGFTKIRSHHNVLNDRVVVYTIEHSEYLGGAHGMETVVYSNYDLRTGDKLTLDDVFTPEGKAALTERIHAQILKDHNAKDWDWLMEESCYFAKVEVVPTENFELTETHITFQYNPYDIACYAQGRTKVKLAYSDLAGFNSDVIEK